MLVRGSGSDGKFESIGKSSIATSHKWNLLSDYRLPRDCSRSGFYRHLQRQPGSKCSKRAGKWCAWRSTRIRVPAQQIRGKRVHHPRQSMSLIVARYYRGRQYAIPRFMWPGMDFQVIDMCVTGLSELMLCTVTEDLVRYMTKASENGNTFLTDDPQWAIDFAPNGMPAKVLSKTATNVCVKEHFLALVIF